MSDRAHAYWSQISFYPLLLDILTDISESHFVAVDLELSGVPTKQVRNDIGKPSLQQRYLETKEAAERYQILQFGLTCVSQDVQNGKYILKPYNFDLNPVIEERGLDIERIFSFQSGAVEFLLRANFDLGRPFEYGVPYLSRAESREAREKHARRQDKSAIADIQIKPTEIESLAFISNAREKINAWLANKKADTPDYVNIPSVGADFNENGHPPEGLSRFEKRLAHQLVRAEYPDLVSLSKRGFVQVVKYDKEREDRFAADRKKELSERINRQKGFRWVIEALLGSDLSHLDLRECARDHKTGEHIFVDMDEFRAQFDRAHALMRRNPRTLVGHNCFLDLVYIYRTFIGDLPPTVTEFQRKLHALWPNVVDTKYMSTHNCGDISPVSSLEQIAMQLSTQEKPKIIVDSLHDKYEDKVAFHEAGYDSFLTAQIAIRLSSKLEEEGKYVEAGGHVGMTTNGLRTLRLTEGNLATHAFAVGNSADFSLPASEEDKTTTFHPSVVGAKWKRRGDPTVPPTNGPHDPFSFNPRDLKHRHRGSDEDMNGVTGGSTTRFDGAMPRPGADFWRVYGNKLRVFGTEENVCVLDCGQMEGEGESEDEGGDVGGDGVRVNAVEGGVAVAAAA